MKENILYLECYSGISGDMTVAALLDLGADQQVLLDGLKSLQVDGYKIEIGRKFKNSIEACDFNVILDEYDVSDDISQIDSKYHDSNKNTSSYHSHSHQNQHDHEHHDHDHHKHDHHDHDHNDHDHHKHDHHDHDHHDHDHHDHDQHEHIHHDHQDHIHHDHQDHNHHDHDHHDLDHHHDHDHLDHGHHHSHDHLHTHDHHDSSSDQSELTNQRSKEITHDLVKKPTLILGHHEHRNLTDINLIIDRSSISDRAKEIAKRIFHIIAVAESKAHAKPLNEVHFHEVGAIDSIVDIVAAAICLDDLNITKVIVSELYEGTGQIKCQHGLLPIPVPGVSNISADYNLRLHITNVKGELVTPTGAAIVAAIKTGDSLPSEMKIRKIGLGAGKRNYSGASGLLRAMLIEDVASKMNQTTVDQVWVLEANIDDCSGEMLSFTMELLLNNGAKDVYYTPIFMKKNRPAYLLGVICTEDKIAELEGIIFVHTTTIGIRKHKAERTILPREQKVISTPYGDAIVKICSYENHTFHYPEFESVKNLCQLTGQDYQTMYHYIRTLAEKID